MLDWSTILRWPYWTIPYRYYRRESRLPTSLAFQRDCIYHTSQECSWLAEWKTPKCWVFFCLGPLGVQQKTSNALIDLYRVITIELERVVSECLPDALRKQELFQAKTLAIIWIVSWALLGRLAEHRMKEFINRLKLRLIKYNGVNMEYYLLFITRKK